jgi:hypothetical protein
LEEAATTVNSNPAQSFMRGAGQNIRKQFGMKTPEEEREEQLIKESGEIFSYLATARRKAEWEWWLNDQFYQGEQYVGFNFTTQRVEKSTGGNDNRIIINKINQNARNVMTRITPNPKSYRGLKRMKPTCGLKKKST